MPFSIVAKDKPDAIALRQANRPEHLVYLEAAGETLLLAGPLLDAANNPIGSLLVVDVADQAAAEAFAAGDPYNQAGLFAEVQVTPFRPAFGSWVKAHG